jgi:hypothetical protein
LQGYCGCRNNINGRLKAIWLSVDGSMRFTNNRWYVSFECTNIPLAAGNARLDETILSNGFSGHRDTRFVHPDPPELIRFWKI